MGWDYRLVLSSSYEINTLSYFSRIVEEMAGTPLFGESFKLAIFRKSYFKSVRIDETWDTDVSPIEVYRFNRRQDQEKYKTVLDNFIKTYREPDCLAESHWSPPRLFKFQGHTVKEPYGAEFCVYRNEYLGYPVPDNHHTGCFYSVGDSRNYNPSYFDDAAAQNLQWLIEELKFISAFQINSIIGIDTERSPDPRDWSLRFFSEPDILLNDLRLIGSVDNDKTLKVEEILKIAQECEDIKYVRHETGTFIYNIKGTGGKLNVFYDKLQDYFR